VVPHLLCRNGSSKNTKRRGRPPLHRNGNDDMERRADLLAASILETGITTRRGGVDPPHCVETGITTRRGGADPPHCVEMGMMMGVDPPLRNEKENDNMRRTYPSSPCRDGNDDVVKTRITTRQGGSTPP